MRFSLLAISTTLLLGGCLSPAEREAAMDAHDNGRCVSFGAQPGTEAYTNCRMQLYDQQMQSYRAPLPTMTAPAQSPTQCRSNVVGGVLYTNCN